VRYDSTVFLRQRLKILFVLAVVFIGVIPGTAQVIGYVEFHPRYHLSATLPGAVLDVRGEEILLLRDFKILEKWNIRTHETTTLYTNSYDRYSLDAFLTATGALLLQDQAIQIEPAEQIELGTNSYWYPEFSHHNIEGRFGLLRLPEGIFLRDFVARTNALISTSLGFADVAPNGSVVFTTAFNETNRVIRRFINGETTTLSVSPAYEIPYVATDGTNVLWSEPKYPFGSVYLQTPSEG
jgi:hypothetical protein